METKNPTILNIGNTALVASMRYHESLYMVIMIISYGIVF